ncbi:MAG TPA: hypothetical protein VNS81_07090 [Nocardioides sp.]|nr:hypothetical protein [Nocardioides sp.]
MRRILISGLVALLVAAGLAAVVVSTSGGSSVTRARLERSLPGAFARVYTQEAHLLGHDEVTPTSLQARAMCDDGEDNLGPGSTWVCLMSWSDPDVPMPTSGYGKFELNVHSNDCYTAGAPSQLIGYQTLTDKRGDIVPNPAYEFDVCFDPKGPDAPTGVLFPSALNITTTSLTLDDQRRSTIALTCGTGVHGCVGTIAATTDSGQDLGSIAFKLRENATSTLTLPAVPRGTTSVELAMNYQEGVGNPGSTLPVAGG